MPATRSEVVQISKLPAQVEQRLLSLERRLHRAERARMATPSGNLPAGELRKIETRLMSIEKRQSNLEKRILQAEKRLSAAGK